jgi:gas vesicle protein
MGNNTKVIFALLGGAVIGAAIGILLAPAKGEETRKKVADAARKAAEKVKDNLKTVVNSNNSFSEDEAGV